MFVKMIKQQLDFFEVFLSKKRENHHTTVVFSLFSWLAEKTSARNFQAFFGKSSLQKGGVPAAPSGTATLLRLSPSYRFYPRTLLLWLRTSGPPRLPWLDGRCVQGPGTYSPRHG